MEEAPENGKESSHSAHAYEMRNGSCYRNVQKCMAADVITRNVLLFLLLMSLPFL
jgi:hypothetical protein